MSRRLLIGVLTAVLMATVLPGLTAAKDDGKSDCKRDGWSDWVREDQTAFADQGECVAYVAEGGMLMPPVPTFRSTCLGLGGEYRESYASASPACLWWGVEAPWEFAWDAHLAFYPYCPGWLTVWGMSVAADPDWIGCQSS